MPLYIAAGLRACGSGGGNNDGGEFTVGGQAAQTSLSLKLGEKTQPVELDSGNQTTLSV